MRPMTAVDIKAVEAQIREGEKLNQLIQQKNELLKTLLKIESEIAGLTGKQSTLSGMNEVVESFDSTPEVTTKQPDAPKYSGSKRGRKPKGELSLANHILFLVEGNPSGLDRSQIVEMLLKGGYQSGSKSFADVVASTLSSLKSKSRIMLNENGKFIPNS